MPRGRPWGSRQCSRWIPCGASCAFEQCWLHGLCGLPCTKLWVQVPVNNTGFMCLWTTLALCACGQQKPYVPVNNACFTCFHILINTGYMCLWTTVASHAYKQHWTHIPSNTGWSDFMCLWTKCWLCVPVNNIGFMCLWTTLSSTKGMHMPVQKKIVSPQVFNVREGADAQCLWVTAHSIEVPRGVESHCAYGLNIFQWGHWNKPRLAPAASL